MEVRVRDQFSIDKGRFEKLRFICKASEFPAIQRSKLTYDKFKWALCIVRSRFVSSFDSELAQMDVSWLKLGTPYDSGALCPYFDMINHSTEDCNAKYYYTVKGSTHGLVRKPLVLLGPGGLRAKDRPPAVDWLWCVDP